MVIRVTIVNFLILSFLKCNVNALYESNFFGKLNATSSISATYDSRVYGIPSAYYGQLKAGGPSVGVAIDELKSEDDFILKFSPAVHLTKKFNLFSITGSAGFEISQYLKNNDKSYLIPITTLNIDFDETLSKRKRISNNAKIRFESTFDFGQKVGASVLEQDLVSYSYFNAGFNVRYNHSSKFGVGGGTTYGIQKYQAGSTAPRVYQDLTTLPISLKAFYIYSEKLDFFTDYTFSRSSSGNSSQPNLIDSKSHSVSFGADGQYSSKLSGDISLGYTLQTYDQEGNEDQNDLIMKLGLSHKLNSKTSSNFNISRSFSPSAQGFSTFSTNARIGLSHRFIETLSGTMYLSASKVAYTYPFDPSNPNINFGESNSMNTYGFGFSIRKSINKIFSANGGYDFSIIDRSPEAYSRHVLMAQLNGRF